MDLEKIEDTGKSFAVKLNEQGIPIPLLRDPVTKVGSVSFSLVILSTALVVAHIVGKCAGYLGGVDPAVAMQFFYASCSLYIGHAFITK
jgi:hypothetical protein